MTKQRPLYAEENVYGKVLIGGKVENFLVLFVISPKFQIWNNLYTLVYLTTAEQY